MIKEKSLDELNDELKKLTRKKYELIIEADKLDKETASVSEKIYEASPDYVKVTCWMCGGNGYVESDEIDDKGRRRKVKCQLCQLRKFVWAKLWEGD